VIGIGIGPNGGGSNVLTELAEIRTALGTHVEDDHRVQHSILDQLERIGTAVTRLDARLDLIADEQVRQNTRVSKLFASDAVQTAQLDSVRPKLASLHDEQIKLSVMQRHPKATAGVTGGVAAVLGVVLGHTDAVERLLAAALGLFGGP